VRRLSQGLPTGLLRLFSCGVVFWSGVALVFGLQNLLLAQAQGRAAAPLSREIAGQLASWLPCALLTPAVALVAVRYRFRAGAWTRAAIAHLLAAVVFLVVGGALMGASQWLLPWIRDPAGVVAAMRTAIVQYLGPDFLIYVLMVAAVQAGAYARESRERALAAATYERQLAEAKLHVLNAQLQPHFLFNALHAISALVWQDPGQADRLLARLSELLRLTLRNSTMVETTLDDELALLERYADLQRARYGERLQITFEIDPLAHRALVPRLILQPLVENAVRHGITRRITPGRVEVRAAPHEGRLRLTIRDDGIGLPSDGVREGMGLSITRARLQQLYGAAHEFDIAPVPGGGVLCTLELPLRLGQATAP
jgi:two-component system, LytTR family, sensor kinase